MSLEDLKLNIGKSYNIDYVIKELEKAPEVQLGHIVLAMTHEHKYHVNKLQLEELSKEIKDKIAKGGKEYEKIGRKFVPLTDITILSIIDPYARYEKYNKFYASLEPQIVQGIEDSKRDQVAAPTEAIITEARNIVTIENEEDFLDGMGLYFKRKGIDTSPIQGGKYILFERRGPPTIRRVLVSEIEVAEKEYEKYKANTPFYEDFFNQIIDGMTTSKKNEIGAQKDAIITEAQNRGFDVVGKEEWFLKGMELYFKIRKIVTGLSKDKKYLVFEKKE